MNVGRSLKETVGITAALGLLVGVGWFDHSHVVRMRDAEALVAHTHEVRTHLNRLRSSMEGGLANTRGFVVTGDPQFLRDVASERENTVGELDDVCRLARDSMAQQTRCAALSQMIPQRLALSLTMIDTRRERGFDAARDMVAAGQMLMDRIRQTIADMDGAEQALLEQRAGIAAREARFATVVSSTTIGVAFALFAGIFVLMRRERRVRQEAQEDFERFFAFSLDLLCIAQDGYFKRVNQAFASTLDYTLEELSSTPFMDFVHPEDRPATLAEVEKLVGGVPTINFQNRYRCRDGSWRWLSWKAQALPGSGLIYAAARDVTDRRQAQQQIETLNEELQLKAVWLTQANKELESFSYSVSHDLRAPLRSIDGFSQILLEENAERLNDEGKDALSRVRKAAKEMGDLIDALLDLSRISRAELRAEAVNLSDIASSIVAELQNSQPERRADVSIAPGVIASGDVRLLRAMLGNLLGNAWKYSGPRDVTRIEFGAVERNQETVFFVRDNGVGFDMAYVGKLFGAFQRLHRKTDFAGTGVGLATVQRIVHRHGGRVWAEGAVDHGATFYFTLGVSPEHQEAA